MGSTAIFTTYDDCGCFYDHVSPPRDLELCNPMVIVSPWASRAARRGLVRIRPQIARDLT